MELLKKYPHYILLCIAIISLSACKDKFNTSDVDCNECYVDKPDSALLIVNLTINNQFEEIPILLYSGNIDNGTFIDTFYCFMDPAKILVKSEGEYSAKAIYSTDERTVYVVDGTKIKQKRVSDYCDETCWVTTNNVLYLRLSY